MQKTLEPKAGDDRDMAAPARKVAEHRDERRPTFGCDLARAAQIERGFFARSFAHTIAKPPNRAPRRAVEDGVDDVWFEFLM